MTARRFSRAAGDGRAAAPVRLVHLGLGNFFRAHQAWYTERAPDGSEWGHAAWAGRSGGISAALQAQECLYALVVRGPLTDWVEVVSSLSEAQPGSDHHGWLHALASPRLAAVTVTVTEAGYPRGADDQLDACQPAVVAGIARLQGDLAASVTTAPARLAAGLAARRRTAGPRAL